MTPEHIKAELDKYVIGQEEAKKYLALAGYNHFKRKIHKNLKKSNVLLIGPTGCGKTYLVSTLAKILKTDFLTTDATQFSSSGYKGRDVEEIIKDLIVKCENSELRASKSIVYIDEIDKIRKNVGTDGPDVGGLGVQQGLLKLIEGSEVPYQSNSGSDVYDKSLNTSGIMFICSGAFVDLPDTSIQSLTKYGMIPEFLGRFSIITKLHSLTVKDYKKILTDSKGSVLLSYQEWFESEGIELIVEDSALTMISLEAIKKNLGARGLHSTIEEALINAQFEAPSMKPKPKALVVTSQMIANKKPNWRF